MRLEDTKGGPGHLHLAVLKRAKRDDRDPAPAGAAAGAAARARRDDAEAVADEPLALPADPAPASAATARPTVRPAVPSGPIVTGIAGWRKRQRRLLARRVGAFAALALATGFVVGWLVPSRAPVGARPPLAGVADGGAPRSERPPSDAPGADAADAARTDALAAPAAEPVPPPPAGAAEAVAPPADAAGAARVAEIPARQVLRATLERPDVPDDTKLGLVAEVARDRSDAATDALLAATQGASLIAAMAAVKALAGRACPHIEAPLIGLLGHTDWQRRAWAAKMLGEDGCTAARAPLRNRLGIERDERVRTQIGAAVRALGGRRR